MNREQYLEQLEQKNGYCRCPKLADLFEKRRAAISLEARCSSLKDNADLDNPQSSDINFLQHYKTEVEALKRAVEEYHSAMYSHTNLREIYLAIHDSDNKKVVAGLPIHEAKRVLMNVSNPIITAHCLNCNQQIDIVSSID